MKQLLLSIMTILAISCTAGAYDCSAWPEGAPLSGGGTIPPLGEHTFTCTANWVGPIQSNVTTQAHQLVYTRDEWNKTNESVSWTETVTISTTHSWSVGASVRADLKAGILARVIADAKISVEVNGEYSGSKTKTRSVTLNTTIAPCRGKGRREYVDKYTANVSQETADYCWVRDDGLRARMNLQNHTGSGSGDDGLTGEFIDLGPYSQSTDNCKACYKAP